MAEQWLSIVEYARATGTSDMTIRRRIRTGKIRADLRDGKYFIAILNEQSSGPQQLQNNTHANHASIQHNNESRSLIKNRGTSNHIDDRAIPSVRRSDATAQPIQYQVSPHHVGTQHNMHPEYSPNAKSSWKALPGSLTGPLVDAGTASVEARALIEFCDRALNQASSTVQAIEGKYSARLDALTAQLNSRNNEVNILNQQIEDLQLLVQILERKKVS
jgi:hypothetical protein